MEIVKPLLDIAGLLALGLVTVLGALMRKQKINTDDCVPRSEYNDTITSLRSKIDDTRAELMERIDEGNRGTHSRLDKMLLFIAGKGVD